MVEKKKKPHKSKTKTVPHGREGGVEVPTESLESGKKEMFLASVKGREETQASRCPRRVQVVEGV